MDARSEISEFLTSRRARVTPDQVGLPAYGARRVPGLRREEVAVLAGVSVPYYTRLERGDIGGASDGVLAAVAGALRLDDAEQAHLFDLARAAQPGPRTRSPRRLTPLRVPPDVLEILDAFGAGAALLRNARLDILAGNPLGLALYAPMFVDPVRPANTLRFVFLDPQAPAFYGDWESAADGAVATLRSAAGANPFDRAISDLVGELSTRSEEFRVRWAAHNVGFHRHGIKRFLHPVVGEISLNFNRLSLEAAPSLTIFTYTATPGSRDAETLGLLGSWAATEGTVLAANVSSS